MAARTTRIAFGLLGVAIAVAVALSLAFTLRARAATAQTATSGIVLVETRLGLEDAAAAGTGMVLSPSGLVLTNNHVIEGATTVSVVVPQTGRRYPATVVGYDVGADTALLRLKHASGLATAPIGNSKELARGQAVRAVGNAGGAGSLATAGGRVVGLGKTISASTDQGGSERLHGLVETSAVLEPGDSGGPLFDSAGRVVGMDTAASEAGGGFYYRSAVAGNSYAIPIDSALSVVKQIEAGHSTAAVHIGPTALIGVELTSADGGFGFDEGTPTAPGVLVVGVVPGSPADRLGLGYGDLIAEIGGHAVSTPGSIAALLEHRKPGSRISVGWIDPSGGQQSSTLTLAAGPPQ